MNYLMMSLPLLLLAAACGKPGTHQAPEEKIVQTTLSNTFIPLKKQNVKCNSRQFMKSNSFFGLHLFVESKYVLEAKDLYGFLTGTSLRDGKVISQSEYGEEAEIIFSTEGMKAKVFVAAKDIKLCPEETNYAKNTVESAAMNTTYFINKTNKKVSSLFPDLKIAPITLSIGPSLLRSFVTRNWAGELEKQSMYMTDNAFYSPASSLITFLPHSKAAKENGFKANFWEVPMVASHEYGHHVFQSIHKGALSPLECFGTSVKKKKSFNKGLNLDRSVKQEDVLTAYNEGFADLIAHYTLDPKERDVHDVKCLEVSRDVASPVFYNGKPKIFDEEALRLFFSSYNDYTNGTCEDHSYQDVHVIGAIFAHNADKFLGNFTNDNDEKLVAIVDWVKYLKAEKKKLILVTPQNFMKQTMTEFVKMSLKKFGKNLDAGNCKLVKDIYPQLDINECSK